MSVYFIRSGEDGPVKIGVTRNVAARVRNLQTGSAHKLIVIRTIEAGEIIERRAHAYFAKFRLHGEWFKYSSQMLQWMPHWDLPIVVPPAAKILPAAPAHAPLSKRALVKLWDETAQQFRIRVQRHLDKTGEAHATFGRRVLGDPSWVTRLLDGLEPKEATRNKVLTAMKGTK